MRKTEIFNSKQGHLSRPIDTTLVLKAKTSDWQESGIEGFLVRLLYQSDAHQQRTWLMKVTAGARAQTHSHSEVEQIYVLDGQFDDGINQYGPGDYAIRAANVPHSSYSEKGAIILLIYTS